jgi:inorganic pyrophosphatase
MTGKKKSTSTNLTDFGLPEVVVLIEIPEGSRVKYELDEEVGDIYLDRLMPTAMGYPVNYGLIENTAGEDGDALDALLFISEPIIPGVRVKSKMIGVLEMEDEAGIDHKIVCVPASTKIDPICGAWSSLDDLPEAKKTQIKHFFEHYKDLEKGKFVKLRGWQDATKAFSIYSAALVRFEEEAMEEYLRWKEEEADEDDQDCDTCGRSDCDCT